jgi:hypothetical protein
MQRVQNAVAAVVVTTVFTLVLFGVGLKADVSDGPDIDGRPGKNGCGNIVVDVVVDGVTTQYIVPNNVRQLEHFQRKLLRAGMPLGDVADMVTQLRDGMVELLRPRTNLEQFNSTRPGTEDGGSPGCGECQYGRDEIGPPIDCYVGQRPFNCIHCGVCR